MFEDIFSSKPRKTNELKQKPLIIADIHEKDSGILVELQASREVDLEIQSLKIADYLIGEIAIERKAYSDFISSMINRRIIEQLRNLKQYPHQLLILEGFDKNERDLKFNPNAIRGFILSIILNYRIPIIFTKDFQDSSGYLITLAKQQSKPKSEISLHSRIPRTIPEQKQYILESFPNIGPVNAKKLLDKFGALKNVFNANQQDLEEILKKNTENFKKIIESA